MRTFEFHPADASRLSYIASASRRGGAAAGDIREVADSIEDGTARRVADEIAKLAGVYPCGGRASSSIQWIAQELLEFAGVPVVVAPGATCAPPARRRPSAAK